MLFDGQASLHTMPLTTEELYRAHVLNLRAVDDACDSIYRELKRCIAAKQNSADALLKTFTLLIGGWSEVRLLKLLHEPNGFQNAERKKVLDAASKLDQWKTSLEVGFRRRYRAPTAALTRLSLGATAYLQYQEMTSLIENDLKPIIEIRNKLAHGQWARTLNNEMTDVSQPMMALLNTETALSANFKKKIIEMLSNLVNDLIIGGPAFSRDFDTHYRTLEQARTNLTSRSYEVWAKSLRDNYQRGRAARETNMASGR